jgi:hypothetical protein
MMRPAFGAAECRRNKTMVIVRSYYSISEHKKKKKYTIVKPVALNSFFNVFKIINHIPERYKRVIVPVIKISQYLHKPVYTYQIMGEPWLGGFTKIYFY